MLFENVKGDLWLFKKMNDFLNYSENVKAATFQSAVNKSAETLAAYIVYSLTVVTSYEM